MASIFDSLAYENSSIPDSVRRAAQGELDYQRALKAKLPLSTEGSGIPEGVRKAAQAALERGPAPSTTPMGDPWMEGSRSLPEGLFGKTVGYLGKGLGGLGALSAGAEGIESLNQKFGPAAYQNIQSAVETAQTRKAMQEDPELANRGQSTVDRIVGGAMTGVNQLRPEPTQETQGLTDEELAVENPNEPTPAPAPQATEAVEQPPTQDTPIGKVASAAPVTVAQASAKTIQDQESQRQTIEQGANRGLSTGAVSRPEFAEAIVKADAQKSGVELTPDQFKKATAAELANMKSMDNKDVSRYISYALMAAGVLAAVFDKSGKAGDAFSASFNKQLDRNLAAGLQNQKVNAAAAKQAQDLQIALAGLQIKDRQATTQEKSVNQTGMYQQGTLEQRRDAAEAANKLGYYREGREDARSGASLSMQAQKIEQQNNQFNSLLQLRRDQFESDAAYKKALTAQGAERNVIAASKAAKGNGPKGIDITTKDAQGLVDGALDSQGLNVDKPAKAALAQTVRVAAENDPIGFAQDPNGFVLKVIRQKNAPYEQKPGGILTDPTIRQRQLKQQ